MAAGWGSVCGEGAGGSSEESGTAWLGGMVPERGWGAATTTADWGAEADAWQLAHQQQADAPNPNSNPNLYPNPDSTLTLTLTLTLTRWPC